MKLHFLEDRFTRGIIASLFGAIIITAPNLVLGHYLGIMRYLDFASILIYGHKPQSGLEAVFGFVVAYLFLATLGGIFAYVITGITSMNLLLKGGLFGALIWFVSYTITLLFKVPELADIPLKSAFFNLVSGIVWGISMAYALLWLDRRIPTPRYKKSST